METMVDRINILLHRKGMSLRALSIESGVPYMTLNNLMKTGGDTAKLPTLRGIAKCFDISLDTLIDGPLDKEDAKEKAPAQSERELTEKEKQIMAMLPYVPDAVKEGILLILDATVDLTAAEESANSHIEQALALREQSDDAEKQAARSG